MVASITSAGVSRVVKAKAWELSKTEYLALLAERAPLRVTLVGITNQLTNVQLLPKHSLSAAGELQPSRTGFVAITDNGDLPHAYQDEEWGGLLQRLGKERVALGHYAAVQAAIKNNLPVPGKVLMDFLPGKHKP